DPNSSQLASASVQITAGFAFGQDVLAVANSQGLTASFNPNTGTLTLSGFALVSTYQAVLRTVTYQNSSPTPTTAPPPITSSAPRPLPSARPPHRRPLPATPGSLAYAAGQAATAIDPGLTVADIDDQNLVGAIVQITGGFAPSQDQLQFTNQSTITGS